MTQDLLIGIDAMSFWWQLVEKQSQFSYIELATVTNDQ